MPDTAAPVPDAASLDAVSLVRALTAAAGLPLSDEEVTLLADRYPRLRDAADRLQAIAGETDPAPVFDPVPVFGSRI